MINVALSQIDKSVIESLIANEVRESRSLDYKQALPGDKRDAKKEFLYDVSSFANAAGGDLIYGITERREDGRPTGIPEGVFGLGNLNVDAEILRLSNLIRDGIEPRIAGIQFHVVSGFEAGAVLVLRIPKSYLATHMMK